MEQKPISKADRKAEQKICGFHACMAVFHNRPQDIIRAYVTEGTRKAFGPMLKFCAQNRLAYHLVEPADLAKVAESDHTEGVCILAKIPKHPDFNTFLTNSNQTQSDPPPPLAPQGPTAGPFPGPPFESQKAAPSMSLSSLPMVPLPTRHGTSNARVALCSMPPRGTPKDTTCGLRKSNIHA
ncbi:MAG: hypothetical protein EBU49_02285 [Proteobacteria bacterium]|nr:hypothetical protein [Pseudomonadota bacterium]